MCCLCLRRQARDRLFNDEGKKEEKEGEKEKETGLYKTDLIPIEPPDSSETIKYH